MATNFKLKNKEIMNRIGSHWGIRTNTEILEKWGMHPHSLSNWNKTGIPEGILALFSIKENVNYDWLVDGIGEKDRLSIPMPHLIAEPSLIYGKLEDKICKSFNKIPDNKKDEACREIVSVIVGYY